MATKMYQKFNKYWGEINVFFTTACILDPRFKLKLIEYFLGLVYEDSLEARNKVDFVHSELVHMYESYKSKQASSSSREDRTSCVVAQQKGTNSRTSLHKNLDQFLQSSSSSQPQKSDLEFYLDEVNVVSNDDDFDVLAWWKLHEAKYPILSLIARDILSIPASTVASKIVFSTRGRVINQYRSRLESKTIQSLICGQDWLRHQLKDSTLLESEDVLSTLFSSLCVDLAHEEPLDDDSSTYKDILIHGEVEE